MYELFFILYITLYIVSVLGCLTFPNFLKLLRAEKYSLFRIGFNSFTYLFGRLLYQSFFIFSLIIVFPANINIILFKIALVFGFIEIGLLMLSVSFNKSNIKSDLIIYVIFLFLLGLFIGNLINPNSIKIFMNSNQEAPYIIFNLSLINYIFDLSSQIIFLLFFSFLMFVFIYYGLVIHFNSRDKTLSKMILLLIISLCCSLVLLFLYVLVSSPIFRELHFVIILISFLLLLIQYNKGYGVPMSNITSKIYSINIYHKSGVQLYSYKFDYDTDKPGSSIWGNILIGLNHILGEFIDTNNQINVIKTKNSDIIVDYNNEYGFAVLLIINKKNPQLLQMMHGFTKEFEQLFKNELNEIQDLNNLIDISEFKGVEELIMKHFSLYF